MNTIKGLENLDEKIRINRLRNLGENIVKYQYFKTTEIIKIIDNAGYKEETLRSYVNSGINYINTGKKFQQYGNFYQYIDDAISRCVQPLTPKDNQKRQPHFNRYIRKTTSVPKEMNVPVVNVLSKIACGAVKNENIKSSKCDVVPAGTMYGVKMDKNIRIVGNILEAKSFKEGLSFMGKTDAKIIEISFREVDEL